MYARECRKLSWKLQLFSIFSIITTVHTHCHSMCDFNLFFSSAFFTRLNIFVRMPKFWRKNAIRKFHLNITSAFLPFFCLGYLVNVWNFTVMKKDEKKIYTCFVFDFILVSHNFKNLIVQHIRIAYIPAATGKIVDSKKQ